LQSSQNSMMQLASWHVLKRAFDPSVSYPALAL